MATFWIINAAIVYCGVGFGAAYALRVSGDMKPLYAGFFGGFWPFLLAIVLGDRIGRGFVG